MSNPEQLERLGIDRHYIANAVQIALNSLDHAYRLSTYLAAPEELWPIDIADSLHHCQEALNKLNQETSND